MLHGRDIICISSIEWGFLWQAHHEICSRLAAAGNRVLYIENLGARAPRLRDAARVVTRLRAAAPNLSTGGLREVAPNLWVTSPVVCPPFGARWQRMLNRRKLLPAIRRTADRLGFRDPLIWNYLPTDTAADLIDILRTDRSTVVYYCLADFEHLVRDVEAIRVNEARVLKASDVVFANAEPLRRRFESINPNVHLFPIGVDLASFPLAANNAPPPPAVAGIGQPMIGYVGSFHPLKVDVTLLIEAARLRPDWSWVFVGPVQVPNREFEALPNVHFLGEVPHDELAPYIHSFDVGIVPYNMSAYMQTSVPTKINEYLAVGRPVVSTRLPFAAQNSGRDGLIWLTDNEPNAFVSAVEDALRWPDDAGSRQRRHRHAKLADWSSRLEEMCVHIGRFEDERPGPPL